LSRSGIAYALVAYLCWGLIPLYFAQVRHVPAGEILAHRIVWSLLLLAGLLTLGGQWRAVGRAFADARLLLTLLVSAVLLAVNWLLYIYATVTGRVSEAGLGYYLFPLVNAFLATAVLGERLRPAHYPALGLVAAGVAYPFARTGEFTWLALALPVTFGVYGLVRKRASVESLAGLTVETVLLAGPSVAYLSAASGTGVGHFGGDRHTTAWLLLGGIVTVVPLLTFTLSIRRLPLLALSFIQFLSPTLQLALAVWAFGEPVPPERWVTFGCVWAAVLIFITDATVQARRKGQ
jgi:chloramphenicol-sensitive protein RarD